MYEINITPACISARLTAWLIDTAISIGMIAGSIYWATGTMDLEAFILQSTYLQLSAVLLLPLGAQIAFMGLFQRTFGMYAVDIQLLQADGEMPSWSNVIRRPIGVVTMVGSAFLAAFVPLLNDQRRTVGDYISGSRVVESLALGRRVAYDPWRIFKSIIRPLGPIGFAVTLGLLLLSKSEGANKDVFLDAVVIAALGTLLIATLIAAVKVKVSRVRITPKGIQRSGWLGWSRNLVEWGDIDHSRIHLKRLFPYFEVHRNNKRRFKVPLEHSLAQYTAEAMMRNGVRIEQ